ncbi:hypothetical protein KHP60_04500 [Microvirga sp. 3-52]|uniref:hypothetical protein n=1 Tax=Microvirga sp. 3-52 TaxID=2792425 RepID=UPI001AD17A19|nr:hypothetical protein [Microvirga sp. 3-52]MBO1903993.1 hypothetical protein [Microvirga sp. 3-52]MBS7451606.1 hypothetical protein [Microvirga sp. 3-52]
MRYQSPVPSDPEYIQALGQAVYSYCYLEWQVIWLVERLTGTFFEVDVHRMTGGKIGRAFKEAVDAAEGNVPDEVLQRLKRGSNLFWNAVELRQDLLHAHPFTADGGEQMLSRKKEGRFDPWTIEKIDSATRCFDELDHELNDLFQNALRR